MTTRTLDVRFPGNAAGGFSRPLAPSASRLSSSGAVFAFILLHASLGPFIRAFPWLMTGHALVVPVLGTWWAFTSRRPELVLYASGYTMSAEVLWRMTNANAFHEYGKYTLLVMLLVWVAREAERSKRLGFPPLVMTYFLLLTPAMSLTLLEVDPEQARQHISFNMSGPLCFLATAWFFRRLRLTENHLLSLLTAMVAPAVTLGAIATTSTIMAEEITFGQGSNMITSGGFGPNQVCASLGLGVAAAFLSMVLERRGPVRWLMMAVVAALGTQAALTFSRGGVYIAALAIAFAMAVLVGHRRLGVRAAAFVTLGMLLAVVLITPALTDFTDGAIVTRFEDRSGTGREVLAQSDWDTWLDNFIMGVGPGMSGYSHEAVVGAWVTTHTEYSRMVAEHGLFGALALLLMLISVVVGFARTRGIAARATVACAAGWALAHMLGYAMRIAAAGYMLGIAAGGIHLLEEDDPRQE